MSWSARMYVSQRLSNQPRIWNRFLKMGRQACRDWWVACSRAGTLPSRTAFGVGWPVRANCSFRMPAVSSAMKTTRRCEAAARQIWICNSTGRRANWLKSAWGG